MEQSKKQKQHFVVVHGAWCWYKVVMRLRSEGQHVTALDMAASGADPRPVEEVRSIADFYRPLMELMEGLAAEERVVLVGHSMGGICISAAMEKFPSKIALAVLPGVNSTPLKKAGHCSPPAITPKPSAAVGENFHANLPSNAKIMCCWSWTNPFFPHVREI